MFEFDAGKLIIIAIVALVVIGPKEFPRVMIELGKAVAKLRHMAFEFRTQFMDAMRESGAEEIKSEMTGLAETAKREASADPLATIKAELAGVMEAAGKGTAPATERIPSSGASAEPSPVSPIGLLPAAAQGGKGQDPESLVAPAGSDGPSVARTTDDEMRSLAEALQGELGKVPSETPGAKAATGGNA